MGSKQAWRYWRYFWTAHQTIPPTPIDATDSFYNLQRDIRAIKSDLEVDLAVSDAPDKSSGKNSEGYHPKPSGNTNQNLEQRRKRRKENW